MVHSVVSTFFFYATSCIFLDYWIQSSIKTKFPITCNMSLFDHFRGLFKNEIHSTNQVNFLKTVKFFWWLSGFIRKPFQKSVWYVIQNFLRIERSFHEWINIQKKKVYKFFFHAVHKRHCKLPWFLWSANTRYNLNIYGIAETQ